LVRWSDPLEVVSNSIWRSALVAFRSRSLPSVQAPHRRDFHMTSLQLQLRPLLFSLHIILQHPGTQRISANE
jgi:hypothetical protein